MRRRTRRAADEEDISLGADAGGQLSFAQDIRPLFQDKDRESMKAAFDLFDYQDVASHADAIVGALRSGKMPCDGAWPEDRVQVVRRWIDAGKPAAPVVR